MDVTYFEDICAHMEWADSMVWAAAFEAQDGATDQRPRDTLLHMHLGLHQLGDGAQRKGSLR